MNTHYFFQGLPSEVMALFTNSLAISAEDTTRYHVLVHFEEIAQDKEGLSGPDASVDSAIQAGAKKVRSMVENLYNIGQFENPVTPLFYEHWKPAMAAPVNKLIFIVLYRANESPSLVYPELSEYEGEFFSLPEDIWKSLMGCNNLFDWEKLEGIAFPTGWVHGEEDENETEMESEPDGGGVKLAFSEGRLAFLSSNTNNPYFVLEEKELFTSWVNGWNEAKGEEKIPAKESFIVPIDAEPNYYLVGMTLKIPAKNISERAAKKFSFDSLGWNSLKEETRSNFFNDTVDEMKAQFKTIGMKTFIENWDVICSFAIPCVKFIGLGLEGEVEYLGGKIILSELTTLAMASIGADMEKWNSFNDSLKEKLTLGILEELAEGDPGNVGKQEESAASLGFAAYEAGVHSVENPYETGDERFQEWDDAWWKAKEAKGVIGRLEKTDGPIGEGIKLGDGVYAKESVDLPEADSETDIIESKKLEESTDSDFSKMSMEELENVDRSLLNASRKRKHTLALKVLKAAVG